MDPRWRRWRTSWRKLPLLSLPPISQLFPKLPPNLHPCWPTLPKIKFPASNCHVPILIVYSNSPFIFICKCTFLYTLRIWFWEVQKQNKICFHPSRTRDVEKDAPLQWAFLTTFRLFAKIRKRGDRRCSAAMNMANVHGWSLSVWRTALIFFLFQICSRAS